MAVVTPRMMSKSYLPEYRHWINMKTRCFYSGATGYEIYGGRGITVCERWRNSFDAFFADVGPRPSSRHSLDRIDVNGHYEPGNVRWATAIEQGANMTNNIIVSLGGETVCLSEAARRLGLKVNTIQYRLRRGWPIERALTPQLHRGGHQ